MLTCFCRDFMAIIRYLWYRYWTREDDMSENSNYIDLHLVRTTQGGGGKQPKTWRYFVPCVLLTCQSSLVTSCSIDAHTHTRTSRVFPFPLFLSQPLPGPPDPFQDKTPEPMKLRNWWVNNFVWKMNRSGRGDILLSENTSSSFRGYFLKKKGIFRASTNALVTRHCPRIYRKYVDMIWQSP